MKGLLSIMNASICVAVSLFLGYASTLELAAKQMAGPVIRYPWIA
jgi:hypothetical protein